MVQRIEVPGGKTGFGGVEINSLEGYAMP